MLEARTVHVVDLQGEVDEYPEGSELARNYDFRTVLCVPLIRAGAAIGVIAIRRTEARSFTERQADLLKTFADQAVIAIENVRLFKELEARNRDLTTALDQQTATSEILRVISSSPTEVQPVFDAILRSAVRLCDGFYSALFLVDGPMLHFRAGHNLPPQGFEAVKGAYPLSVLNGSTGAVRAVRDRCVVHIMDLQEDPDASERTRQRARLIGLRTWIGVPMMHEGTAIGAVGVSRRVVKPFSEREIALLQTFADQAVIAIENVRLFTELQDKNGALTQAHAQVSEALDQQTATSEILRVISTSPTDIQPVLDAVASSAARLCDSLDAGIFRVDGDVARLVAHQGPISTVEYLTPMDVPVIRGVLSGRAIIERRAIQVADLQAETQDFPEGSARARRMGFRTQLSVPLLREGVAIGVIALRRIEARPFSDSQIALLQTFAD